jgi:subtilisin family serine protease
LVEENAIFYATQTPACVRQTTTDWGLTRIPQISRVASNAYDYINRAEGGVTVYVVDSGIRRTHTDFGGRAVFGVDTTCGNVCANPPRTDQNGHGTHVAGTVGGRLYGVAKTVRMVDVRTACTCVSLQCAWRGAGTGLGVCFRGQVRVLDARGSGSTTGIVNGINWLANNCRASGRTYVILPLVSFLVCVCVCVCVCVFVR